MMYSTISRHCAPRACRLRLPSPFLDFDSLRASNSAQQSTDSKPYQPALFSSLPECGKLQVTGSMHLIMGPMFAGKSTELLRRAREAQVAGKSTFVVKPKVDTRYEQASVTTHDGDTISCHTLDRLLPLLLPSGEEVSESSPSFQAARSSWSKAQFVAIDEAQFFPDLLDFATQAVEIHGKELLIAGLDGDFKRRKFGSLIDLIPLADSVLKVKGRCRLCDKESLFSFRTAKESQQALIGGEEAYIPVCRQHYVQLESRASSS